MKAIVCPQYGSPEVLQFTNLEQPIPGDYDILIKVKATTVAVADTRARAFNVPPQVRIPARLALGIFKPRNSVLGVELSGTVVQTGKLVTQFKVGDQVMAASLKKFGAYAEYICLSENDTVVLAPKNISLVTAAALPVGAQTALHFLEKGNISRGQKILVYGASGSVGSYAIQIAKNIGTEATAVCSSINTSILKTLGADCVLDYTSPLFHQQLQQYDTVFVAVDQLPFSACRKIIRKGGTYINITNPFPTPQQLWLSLTGKMNLILAENVPETKDYLQRIKAMVEAGVLTPVIDQHYTFDQMIEAHRYVDKGHKKGNVVVTLD